VKFRHVLLAASLLVILACGGAGGGPSLEPKQTAFFNQDLQLIRRDISTGQDTVLFTSVGYNPVNIRLSPDGQRLVFRTGINESTVLNIDGSNPVAIPGFGLAAWLTNDRLVVANNDKAHTIDADATDLSAPFADMPSNNIIVGIDVHPGTQKVLLSHRQATITGLARAYLMNLDGTGSVALTPDTAGCQDMRWSPDGTRIAFSLAIPTFSDHEIHIMNADGTGDVTLPNFSTGERPYWKSDSELYYTVNRQIWLTDDHGSSRTLVATLSSTESSNSFIVADF
jgi:Tol biopolymer transport system component